MSTVSLNNTVSTRHEGIHEDGRPHILQDKDVPPYVTILRIHGPFLFGTTEQLAEETANLSRSANRHPTAAKYDRD